MRKTVLVLVGCLVLAAAPAWAGGAFSLFGTYGQVNSDNNTYGAGARVSLGGESFLVDLTATWYPSVNGMVVREGSSAVFDSIQFIPIDLGVRYLFGSGSELRPYIGAGGSYGLVQLGSGEADDEFGYYGVAGFQLGSRPGGGLFFEVIYRWIETDVAAGGAVYESQRFGGLAGSVGFGIAF